MFVDRYGELKRMNNGQLAKIIRYDGVMNIDVEFEDGTVVRHRQYNDFVLGKIANPTDKEKRLGETKKMNCGLKGTIIAYRKSNDIDVKLEDGTIIRNRDYSSFKRGSIRINTKDKYLNKPKMMKCGLEAKIIEYRNSTDVDVEFEDGVIVKNKTCASFEDRIIKHPNINGHIAVARQKHLGQTKMMRCGMEATVIEYRRAVDLDVRFADGTIVKNRAWSSFKDGRILNPNLVNIDSAIGLS